MAAVTGRLDFVYRIGYLKQTALTFEQMRFEIRPETIAHDMAAEIIHDP